jgi:hypothetical protein
MSRTEQLIGERVPPCLTSIVMEYLCPPDPNYWDLGFYGYYERCIYYEAECPVLEGAAEAGHAQIVKALIDERQWFLAKGLRAACKGGDSETIGLLVNAMTPKWNSIMECASYGGRHDIIDLAIQNGAHDWGASLLTACLGRRYDVADFMIEKGASWGCVRRAVGISLEHGDPVSARQLLTKWGHPAPTYSPFAVRRAYMKNDPLLIEAVNTLLTTPPHPEDIFAGICGGGRVDDLRAFGDVDQHTWHAGMLAACTEGQIDIARELIKSGTAGWNIYMCYACRKGHLPIVKLMIQMGANDWNNALSAACNRGHPSLIRFILECGADPGSCDHCSGKYHLQPPSN